MHTSITYVLQLTWSLANKTCVSHGKVDNFTVSNPYNLDSRCSNVREPIADSYMAMGPTHNKESLDHVRSQSHSLSFPLSLALIFSDLRFADSLSSGIFFSFTGSAFFSLTLFERQTLTNLVADKLTRGALGILL
ncbi:hypothetical protein YC2023_021911 [Brassica napus]